MGTLQKTQADPDSFPTFVLQLPRKAEVRLHSRQACRSDQVVLSLRFPTGAEGLDRQSKRLSGGTIHVIDQSMPTICSHTTRSRDIGPSRSTSFRHLGEDLHCAGSEAKRPLAVV